MPAGTAARRSANSGVIYSNTATSCDTGNSAIWSSWNAQYTITGCTATSSSDGNLIWRAWNQDWGTCGTNTITTAIRQWHTVDGQTGWVSNNQVWASWNNSWAPTPARVYGFPAVHRELTPEERAARAAEEERRRLEYEAQQAERKLANANAQKLLLSVLNEEQKRDWAAHGHFYLHVGDRKYRIKRGRSGNVELVDPQTNEPLERFCAHPVQAVPDEDTAVAQMMYLKYDERRFIGLANSHWTKPGHESLKRRMAA
jgi:hypothetical protein